MNIWKMAQLGYKILGLHSFGQNSKEEKEKKKETTKRHGDYKSVSRIILCKINLIFCVFFLFIYYMASIFNCPYKNNKNVLMMDQCYWYSYKTK